MPAIKRNLLIEQGATGTDPAIFTWHNPRYVFKVVQTAGSTNYESGLVEPVWPMGNCDCDNISDGDLVWACERRATEEDWRELKLWCASTGYPLNSLIISPKVPVDLTGYTASMQIRTEVADDETSEVLFSMTNVPDGENNYIELGDAAGTIEFVLQAGRTAQFDWESALYDLELISPSQPKYPAGFVTRLLKGSIKVDKESTRP